MSNSLSLCVICKNEEKSIGTLLDSVKGSLFDEIVIVDTGSTDRTLEILSKYKVKVEHFKWINDFSAARNYSFSKATKDYIMWADSDDYIKPKDYQKLLELKPVLHESPIWLLKYEYAHDDFGNSICSFYRERIVKRDLNIKWEQPIHEYMPLLHPYRQVDIEIHHNKKESHTKRNLSILEGIVEKDPNNSRNVYYLGKEYFDSGDTEKGLPFLIKFIEMKDAWSENKYGALIRLAEFYLKQDKSLSKEYLHKAISLDPLKAKAYYYLGDISLGEKDYQQAVHWFKICTQTVRSERSLDIIEPKYHTWLPYLQMCIAYNSMGKVYEAAEANEKALSFSPKDTRMINNRNIFMNVLKDKYPNYVGEKQSSPSLILPKYAGKIGWYCWPNTNFASHRIRMINICKNLWDKKYQSYLLPPEEGLFDADTKVFDDYDVIVTYGLYSVAQISNIKVWKQRGITVIADINEDILEYNYVLQTLIECDHVVCCSESLKNKISKHIKPDNITVIEDAVEYISGGNYV